MLIFIKSDGGLRPETFRLSHETRKDLERRRSRLGSEALTDPINDVGGGQPHGGSSSVAQVAYLNRPHYDAGREPINVFAIHTLADLADIRHNHVFASGQMAERNFITPIRPRPKPSSHSSRRSLGSQLRRERDRYFDRSPKLTNENALATGSMLDALIATIAVPVIMKECGAP